MITKHTHFNPCFWTAYWNKDYYDEAVSAITKSRARDQEIFSLNIKANKILPTKIERVHCEKNLGLSEITEDGIRDYIVECYPNNYERYLNQIESDEFPLLLCYENLFTKIEELPPYKVLEKIICTGRIENFEEKVWLSSFIVLQRIRGHAFINSMVEAGQLLNKPKFEYMLYMRHFLSDQELLFKVTYPIGNARWTLHISDRHRLPLCDSPILQEGSNIFVALSPRILLEIDMDKCNRSGELTKVKNLNKNIVSEFKKRTVSNTYKEIICNSEQLLKSYQSDPFFKAWAKKLKEASGFNSIIETTTGKEIYQIGAL